MTGEASFAGDPCTLLDLMERMIGDRGRPVPMEHSSDPFAVLVSTLVSLRTRDAVTSTVSASLLARGPDPRTMLALDPGELENLLRPAGFFRRKAVQLREICTLLLERHAGAVPGNQEDLLALPGVGLKTASFMMGMVFGTPSVCVDVHVHRISNRLGLVTTDTPERTKEALEALFPRERWTSINSIMVGFGQRVCRPVGPRCNACRLRSRCPSAEGVAAS